MDKLRKQTLLVNLPGMFRNLQKYNAKNIKCFRIFAKLSGVLYIFKINYATLFSA